MCRNTIRDHGGSEYSREFPVERIYRDAHLMTTGEWTSEGAEAGDYEIGIYLATFALGVSGVRIGAKVYPQRLRQTRAMQLLNAGCWITSIQRFLDHKELSSTMICAHAHDQTVA